MSKVYIFTLVLAIMFSVGCASNAKIYTIEANLYPLTMDEIAKMSESASENPEKKLDAEKEIYHCEIKIKEIMYEGEEKKTEKIVCAPKLTFYKGEKANMTISDSKNENGITAEVMIDDTKETETTKVDVCIKEDGKTVAYSKLKLEAKRK